MTVQDLIDRLNGVEDKDALVFVDSGYYDHYIKSSICINKIYYNKDDSNKRSSSDESIVYPDKGYLIDLIDYT